MARRLTDRWSRQVAQRTLDGQWNFMRRLAREGIVHFCVWNKYHHKEQRNEIRHGLIGGMEDLDFIRKHMCWFGRGAYDRKRNTFPLWLTAHGRAALRSKADQPEMVFGGLTDPGFKVMPLDFHRDLNEQRQRQRERLGLRRAAYIGPLILKPDMPAAARRRKARP